MYVSVYLSICLSVYLSTYLSVNLSIYRHICVHNLRTAIYDDQPGTTLQTRTYGNHGIFPVLGHAGFISSTVGLSFPKP